MLGEGSEQAGQGYVMAMQGVDRDRCQWTALPKCNLPWPVHPPISGGLLLEMFEIGQGLSTQSLNLCSCFLPLCAPGLSSPALPRSEFKLQHSCPSSHSCIPLSFWMPRRAGKGLSSLAFPRTRVYPALLKFQGPSPVFFQCPITKRHSEPSWGAGRFPLLNYH